MAVGKEYGELRVAPKVCSHHFRTYVIVQGQHRVFSQGGPADITVYPGSKSLKLFVWKYFKIDLKILSPVFKFTEFL